MPILKELLLEEEQTLDMVRSSKLDMESKLKTMFRLGASAAFIAITRSTVDVNESLLNEVQEWGLLASSCQERH